MHRYVPSSAGERLCQYIHAHLYDDSTTWRHLENAVRPIGHEGRLTAYYREHAAIFLTCKLISAGKSVSQIGSSNESTLSFLMETYPWNRLNSGNRLLRLLSKAVENSDRPISPGNASEIDAFARRNPHCYICGVTLIFNGPIDRATYTRDHLWPSSHGGDSVFENLLPACNDCNTKKADYPSWITTDVHSLFLGLDPDTSRMSGLRFLHRFALFSREAFKYAIEQQITLKRAFIDIKPWTTVRVQDSDLTADMFNLTTTQDF